MARDAGVHDHGGMSTTLPRRFWEKVQKTESCWIWTASVSTPGYGQFGMNGKNRIAHRLALEDSRGEIPSHLQVDHKCRNKRCVNPSHLDIVTASENTLRGFRAGRKISDAQRSAMSEGSKKHNLKRWSDPNEHKKMSDAIKKVRREEFWASRGPNCTIKK